MAARKRAARPLVDLITEVREHTGKSYRELADRAVDAGYELSFQQLQQYGADTARKAPSRYQVEALAVALDVDLDTVRTAVIEQFYGYTPSGAVRKDDDPLGGLTPSQRAEALRMLTAWRETLPKKGNPGKRNAG